MATTTSSAPTESAAPAQQQAPATATTTAAGAPAAAPSQVESASLYVGDLLPSVTEAIIYEIFNPVAPVVSVRVRRDNSRSSLGHALISFQSRADAERAMDALNFTNIKGKPCRIMWMQRDNTARLTGTGNIFIKNLDPSIDNKALMDTFSLFGKVLSCVVVTNRETGESLGYGYVHFESTEDAEEAIKKTNGMLINGREVHVDWFQKPGDRHAQKSFTNIYVKNIPVHWSDERLKTLFSECGEVSSIAIMKDETGKSRGFGFIDFAKGDAALNAISKFNDFEVKTKEGEEAGAEALAAAKEGEKTESAEKEGETSATSEGEPIPASTAPKLTQRLVVCKAQMKEERAKELRAHFEKEKQERMAKYQGVNLFVKNLHENVDDDMLRKEFTPFGTITSARVMREHQPGSKTLGASKCFGFVCFTSPEEAMKAVTEMNGKQILGKPIYVGLAQRKDERRVELEQQFARQAMIGRNVAGGIPLPVGGPQGMYPGAQVYFQQGPGIRGAPFNFLPQMMPRGAVAGGRPGIPYGANSARGYPGNMGFQPQQGQMGFGPGMMMGPRPRGDGRQAQGQNIKYTAGARNHPMGAYNQGMGGQMMPPMSMMPNGMMMPGQQPQPHIQSAPEPLTAAALANASEEQQKNMIGERLYPLIEAVQPNLAGKITGMLLEMDNPELLHLIESPEALQTKITEALNVLESHDQDKPSQ